MPAVLREMARFAAVGVVNTGVDICLFALLLSAAAIPAAAANVLSYSAGVVTSFVLNGRWTFGSGGRPAGPALSAFALFASAAVAGLLLSTLIVALLEGITGPLVAKAVSVPLVLAWNFLSARRILKAPAGAGRRAV